MIDTTTKKRLRVLADSTAGPYITAPASQLDEIRRVLDGCGIDYWVGENAISINGAPEVIVINLGREADAANVQAALDNAR
jgi:hypothetical protein